MRVITVALTFGLLIGGCAKPLPPLSAETKHELSAVLNPDFTLESVSQERREDLYHILAVFRDSMEPDELVRSVEFTSSTEAILSFSDTGMHNGGSMELHRKSGGWQIELKVYHI